MKLVVLFLVVGVVCAALFLTGVFSPGRSRELQRSADKSAMKAESQGERKAAWFGNLAANAFRKSRKAADRSAGKGREVNRRVRGSRPG